MPCRLNRRRTWAHRIMLEAYQHPDNVFVTLTYSDECMPRLADGRGNLEPKHLQDWLKRIRWSWDNEQKELRKNAPTRIRYFACGEYGDETERPHFHVAIFGYPTCHFGNTRPRPRGQACCPRCAELEKTWKHGQIFAGTLEMHSAQYIAGYVTKKMTSADDPRLDGRHPEFSRMSLRPGIGHSALHEVASQVMRFNLENSQADVPSALRHGSRLMPLGRYLRRELRKLVGNDEKTPQSVIEKMAEELRPVQEAAFDASKPFKKAIEERYKGKVDRIIARQRIFKGRKTI